jgi:hypothetical protein
MVAVFQQVMGIPLSTGSALETMATRKHEQQLHWEYALQLLKELESLLPLRIETARIVSAPVHALSSLLFLQCFDTFRLRCRLSTGC